MKIKVLNIISDTNVGGAGKCLITYCNNYDKDKFEVVVVMPKDSLLKEYIEKTDVRIIEINGLKDKSFDIMSIGKLRKIIREEKADIIHTHSSLSARIAARLISNQKIVYTKHCAFPVSNKYKYGIVRKMYKLINESLTNKVIATAKIVKDDLIKQGMTEGKIEVILNGTDKLIRPSNEKIKEIKDKYGILENEKVIGYLARIEKLKGHDYFVEAAKLICDKYDDYRFIIAGIGSYEQELKQKVKELGIEDKVIFTGFIKDVNEILSIMNIQVNASYISETTNLALLEGLSLGIPVIATDCGGSKAIVKIDENGKLIEKQNSDQLAKAIEDILSDKEKYEYMCKRSIEIFDENFTSKVYTKNIEKVYESMVNENEN